MIRQGQAHAQVKPKHLKGKQPLSSPPIPPCPSGRPFPSTNHTIGILKPPNTNTDTITTITVAAAAVAGHDTASPSPHTSVESEPAQLTAAMANTTLPSSKTAAPAMHRKYSSPMMPPFMVSAPGKVIVYGEHAVVHGKVSKGTKMGRRGPQS